eukprot:5369089-Pyramimonas_sp.AAC.1
MDNSKLWHFLGARNHLRGELSSPVVKWQNKGLMSVLILSVCGVVRRGAGGVGGPAAVQREVPAAV